MTPEEFVRMVAGMIIEGECEEHKHDLESCSDSREVDEEPCCGVACTVYDPSGSDDEVDALYQLIATARQMQHSR